MDATTKAAVLRDMTRRMGALVSQWASNRCSLWITSMDFRPRKPAGSVLAIRGIPDGFRSQSRLRRLSAAGSAPNQWAVPDRKIETDFSPARSRRGHGVVSVNNRGSRVPIHVERACFVRCKIVQVRWGVEMVKLLSAYTSSRAISLRHAFTRRCSVRSWLSGNVPMFCNCKRSNSSLAVLSGSASSHPRTVGQTVAKQSFVFANVALAVSLGDGLA